LNNLHQARIICRETRETWYRWSLNSMLSYFPSSFFDGARCEESTFYNLRLIPAASVSELSIVIE